MRRLVTIGCCLLLALVPAQANAPAGFVQLAGPDGPPASPPRGILSYGTGAARSDAPAVIGIDEQERGERPAAPAGSSTRISGASMAGDAVAFALSPDGQTAVYIADQETLGRFELYAVPVDGSATPIKLSISLVFGAGDQGVHSFQITPDGGSVLFLADPAAGGGNNDLFSVPIDGSASASQLNLSSERPVTGMGILPNSLRAAFFGNSSGATELFKATINSPASSIRLSSAGPSGDVVAALFSPDSSRVLYAAGPTFQWYSVPTGASGPGEEVQLSNALGFVSLGGISPDSGTVVYTADESLLGVSEIFSVDIDGPSTSAVKLNPSMAGSGVTGFRIGPDSQQVAYLADQGTAGMIEAYSATIGSSGSMQLNGTLSGSQSVRSVVISPDGSSVVYEADENTEGTIDVLTRAIDGGGTPQTLHALTAPSNAGLFSGLDTPILGPRAVYPVIKSGAEIETEIDLFSLPIDGSQAAVRVNDAVAVGDLIFNAFVPSAATRLMAWGIGGTSGGITQTVHVGPVRSDLDPEQVNTSAAAGTLGVQGYEISADEGYAVYLQDQNTPGKVELFSRALDSDGDAIANASDNCKYVSNPSQESIVFGQTVLATSGTTFGWTDPADVRFVRGPLAGLAAPVADQFGSLVWTTSFSDTDQPSGSGAGFYYLFGLDCPAGSYETVPGAEPSRNTLP
jgi:Tol biopolymer transport system component